MDEKDWLEYLKWKEDQRKQDKYKAKVIHNLPCNSPPTGNPYYITKYYYNYNSHYQSNNLKI